LKADASLRCVAFEGDRVAIGLDDCQIVIVNLKTPEATPLRITGHSQPIGSLAFHPHNPILLSCDVSGCLKIWTKGIFS
jgi:WD40 repeat protein